MTNFLLKLLHMLLFSMEKKLNFFFLFSLFSGIVILTTKASSLHWKTFLSKRARVFGNFFCPPPPPNLSQKGPSTLGHLSRIKRTNIVMQKTPICLVNSGRICQFGYGAPWRLPIPCDRKPRSASWKIIICKGFCGFSWAGASKCCFRFSLSVLVPDDSQSVELELETCHRYWVPDMTDSQSGLEKVNKILWKMLKIFTKVKEVELNGEKMKHRIQS